MTETGEAWLVEVAAARDAGFTYFDWLSAYDDGDAFVLAVHLWCVGRREGVLLKTRGTVFPSIVGIFRGAAWHERETHEMFGVVFEGGDDRPLLLPDGFRGHPLRKDFVLASRARPWPGSKEPGGEEPRRANVPPGAPFPGASA